MVHGAGDGTVAATAEEGRVHEGGSCMLSCGVCVLKCLQGNISMPMTRLLRAVLLGRCLWTSLQDIEGLSFGATRVVKELYR